MLRVVKDESESGEMCVCVCVYVVVTDEDVVPDRDSWPSSVTSYTKRSPVGYHETSSSL